MRQITRVNEYYDLFDVKTVSGTVSSAMTDVPNTIANTNMTNPFRGFSNWEDFATNNPNNTAVITGQHKSSQATNSLHVDDNGDIWCYPPNVTVPYWTRIIFRNYDYTVNVMDATSDAIFGNTTFKFINYPTIYHDSVDQLIPEWIIGDDGVKYTLWNTDNSSNTHVPAIYQSDFTGISGIIDFVPDYRQASVFLRYDEYPSRSKVIFSNCDKTRNPDIVHNFAYHKGQMEPIKLNLSLSANISVRDPSTPTDTYNQNLTKQQITNYLKSCYWCIEWVYEPDDR